MGKPGFIIGGAARSGTTSLHRWLAGHPDIVMAEGKELRFFDQHYTRGWEWYVRQLPDSGPAMVGEASPRYLSHPHAAERIATHLPGIKVIFSLRDPVERAYSDYWMDRARGRGPASFEEAIEDPAHAERYLGTGYYAEHIARFHEALSESQVAVVLFDDLVNDPENTCFALCRFLGLPSRSNEQVGRAVNGHVRFRSLAMRRLSRRLPRSARRFVGRVNTRKVPYPRMPVDVRRKLEKHFVPYNADLAELLGRQLPWG